MTQFTCKGVKQINNRISFKHLYHSYLSAFFISAGIPNGEFPEILIAKCRSRFYCTWFFCWGETVREINVSRAWDPVHAGEKALTRETPAKRGRVNRYGICQIYFCTNFINRYICKTDKNNMGMIKNTNFSCFIQSCGVLSFGLPCFVNNPFLIISFFREAYNVRYSNFKINF
jgi:hypothetical protein